MNYIRGEVPGGFIVGTRIIIENHLEDPDRQLWRSGIRPQTQGGKAHPTVILVRRIPKAILNFYYFFCQSS